MKKESSFLSFLFAISALSWSGIKISVDLVIITLKSSLKFSANFFETANAISFSLYPFPIAPVSFPPCPGSITIVYFFLGTDGITTTGCFYSANKTCDSIFWFIN